MQKSKIVVWMGRELYDKLVEYSMKQGLSMSAACRSLMLNALDSLGAEENSKVKIVERGNPFEDTLDDVP